MEKTTLVLGVFLLAVAPLAAAVTTSDGFVSASTGAGIQVDATECSDPDVNSETQQSDPWSGQATAQSSVPSCLGHGTAGASASTSFTAGPYGFSVSGGAVASAHSTVQVVGASADAVTGVTQRWTIDADQHFCGGFQSELEISGGTVQHVVLNFWPIFGAPSGVATPGQYDYSLDTSVQVTTSGNPANNPPTGSGILQFSGQFRFVPVGSDTLIKGFVTCDGAPVTGVLVQALTRDTMALLDVSYSGDDGCYLLGAVTEQAILRFTDPSGACAPIEVGPLDPPLTMIDVEMLPGEDVPPAPDGDNGTTPLRLERLDAAGDTIRFTWDVASCPADNYNLLAGPLTDVSSYGLTDASCSVGTSGSFDWDPVPLGDQFFLVVGTDGRGTESSWGLTSSDEERNGAASSGLCGVTTKALPGVCP